MEKIMVITLSPELETALKDQAQKLGVAPDTLALHALRERFLQPAWPDDSRDDWECRLRQVATDCGVSLPHSVLSREEIYE